MATRWCIWPPLGQPSDSWPFEAITLVSKDHVPDDVYEEVRKRFSEEELVNLTLALVTINGWNRLCIGFRIQPGEYQPGSIQH